MRKMRTVILKPIKESTKDYEKIERIILKAFVDVLFSPILRELALPKKTLQNSQEELYKAISAGKITFHRGEFSGEFNAKITSELRAMGAKWDRARGVFRLNISEVPYAMRQAINDSGNAFAKKLATVDKRLAQVDPQEIANQVKVSEIFDRTLWSVGQDITKTLQKITVPPQISAETRKKIADEYQNNLEKDIKKWTDKQVIQLRKHVQKVILSGNRYETLVSGIQDVYGVTERKARFLARQETGLLMAKFKESRYTQAGVHEYIWGCVAGSKNHPVRPAHKALQGTRHRWDHPPVTTAPGEADRRNNPGEDYNCRCFARPIVSFRD